MKYLHKEKYNASKKETKEDIRRCNCPSMFIVWQNEYYENG
jgi:hypothetical protein